MRCVRGVSGAGKRPTLAPCALTFPVGMANSHEMCLEAAWVSSESSSIRPTETPVSGPVTAATGAPGTHILCLTMAFCPASGISQNTLGGRWNRHRSVLPAASNLEPCPSQLDECNPRGVNAEKPESRGRQGSLELETKHGNI